MKNMFLSRKEKKKEEAAPQGGGISRALGKVRFEFTSGADAAELCRLISGYVL